MRVETLTPVVEAAPGARARWRLRVENDGRVPVGYRLRVIGFDPANVLQPPPRGLLDAGASDELDLELLIPDAFAAGHHSIAIEVMPDRAGVAPVIAGLTVTVGTIDDIALAVVPSTIRARRRARFRVDIDNRSNEVREVELEADSAELRIEMQPDRVVLQPGERVRTTGRIRAPGHLAGDPRQHSLTVAARSRSAPAYAPATFQQRALFPRGLRTMLAMLLIVAIWGGALGAGYLWWTSRQDESAETVPLVDTDGDGIADTPGDQLIDTDGDGQPDTVAAVVAEQVAAGDQQEPPQPGGSGQPTRTSMGGTVGADGGQATGVDVTLTPIDVGAPPPDGATVLGFRNGVLQEVDGPGGSAGKIWPTRFGRYEPATSTGVRQTQSVPDKTATDERGVWFFGSVAVGQSYEVSFSRPGFDTQSFVLTPSVDGKPIDLPVEMQPATGAVRGTVTGPSGPLGNVQLTLTDGTLVFDSATASEGDVGTFAFTGVSTPGTYTLLATAAGLGTEVVQVTLEAGEQRAGVNIRMRAGVGSISGRVTEGGTPLGGVTLTASNGDTTVETTSLTEGSTGTYLFPRLDIPGRWTIEARLDGYVTQTRLVNLTGNVSGVDFAFVKQTGSITGLVESSRGGGIAAATVRVSRDKLRYENQTAAAPDAGSFNIRDLPPGSYLVEFTHFDHEPTSQTVTIEPGRVADLGTITLVYRPRPAIPQNGGLEVRVIDSEGNPIAARPNVPGPTVRVFRNSDDSLVAEQVGAADQSSFFFQPIPIGTYRIEVTRGDTYRMATRRTSIGLVNVIETIPIYLLGQVHGRLVDSADRTELVDYDVQIRRINPDGSPSDIVQNLPVTLATRPRLMPDGSLQRRFESANPPGLTTGRYVLSVDNPPPGYRVLRDQILQAGQPPMTFVITPTTNAPIDLGDILADRYPEVHAVVVAPRLDAAGPTGARAVSFVPIDDNSLRATLLCPGIDGIDASFEVTPTRTEFDTRVFEGFPATPGYDSFYIDPVDLQRRDMFGACRLDVSTTGYVTKSFAVTIEPIRGRHNEVHRNIALVRPRDVAGHAYWIDDGIDAGDAARIRDANDVTVRLQTDPITGFDPGTVPYTTVGGGPPTPVSEPVASATTDAGGNWAFPFSVADPAPPPGPTTTVLPPRQVFGQATYAFELTGRFTPRWIQMTIDETSRTAVGVLPPGNVPPVSNSGDEVELDSIGGDITGRVDIRTIRGTSGLSPLGVADLTGFTAALSGANAVTGVVPRVAGPNVGLVQGATVPFGATPDAGTHQWSATVAEPPVGIRPRFVPLTAADAAPSPRFFQPPGTSLSPATTPELVKTYVEMGNLNVQVVTPGGAVMEGANVDVGGATTYRVTTGSGADNVLAALPVSLALNGSTGYQIALAAPFNPRLDVDLATVQIFNAAGQQISPNGCLLSSCNVVSIPQGGQPRVRITVPRYGTLIGTVCGVSDPSVDCDNPAAGTERLEYGPGQRLVVTARRIAVALPNDPTTCVAPPGPVVSATVEASAAGSFIFFGPPGYYEVTVSHPDHETIPGEFAAQDPAIDHQCLGPPSPIFPFTRPVLYPNQPVYQLRNETPALPVAAYFRTLPDEWKLLRLRSVVTIEVRTDQLLDLPGDILGDLLPGANVVFGLDNDANLTTPPASPIVNGPVASGRVVVDADGGVLPGLYQVRVSSTDYFPLAFNVRVVPGGNAVTIQVPLPRTGGRIAGDVVAINSEGDAVLAPVGVDVSDAYDAPDPVVTNGTLGAVDDPDPPADEPAVTDTTTTPPGMRATYLFEGLGTGSHVLTFSDAGPAYPDTPGAIDVDVLGPAMVDAEPAVYGAANRTGVVTVTSSGNVLGAVVTLVDPDATTTTITLSAALCGVTPPEPPAVPRATECVVELPPLPPETNPYQVSVSKTLYTTDTESVVVAPGDPAVDIAIALTLDGSVARLNGQVRRVETEGQTDALFAPSGTTVRLLRIATDGTATEVEDETTASDGSYQIDVTANGTYALEAALTGYAGRRGATFVIGTGAGALAPLGEEATVPAASEASIEKVATVTVDVTGTGLDVSTVTGVAIASGAGAPSATIAGARDGDRFTFSLDPAWSYQFRFTSTAGFLAAVVPAAATGVDIGQDGADPDHTATLQPRTITGTVAGATGGTVRVVNDVGAQVGSPVDIGGDGRYTLPGPFAAGDHRLVAEQLGVGRGTATANVAGVDSPNVEQPISLAPRDVAVTFTSTPAGATIRVTASGTPALVVTGPAGTPLTVPENRFPISYVASLDGYVSQPGSGVALAVNQPADTRWNATALTMTGPAVTLPGRTIGGSVSGATAATVRARGSAGTVVGAVASDVAGTFTLAGPFVLDDYTVVAEQTGVGRATAAVEIDEGTDPNVTDVALTLAPRAVAITFSSVPAGAAISITTSGSPALVITGAAGSTPLEVPENRFPISYTVSSPGFVSTTVTGVALAPAQAAATRWDADRLTMSITAPTLSPRTISGTVTGANGGTVRAVSSGGVVGPAVPIAGDGTFSLPGPFVVDTYRLVAEQLGVGRGVLENVGVGADSDPSLTGRTIGLTARSIAVTFGSTPPNAAVEIVTRALPGSPPLTITGVAGPTTPLSVPEDRFPVRYTVSAPNYTSATGSNLGLTVNQAAGDTWNITTGLTMTGPSPTLVAQ